jgi:hypothetical protein
MEATKERVVECVANLRHALRQERMAAGTGCDHPPPIFIQEMSDEGLLAWDLGIYELALFALEARESSAIQVSRESWDRLLEQSAKLETENAFLAKQVERSTARVKLIEARAELAKSAMRGTLDDVYELRSWEESRILEAGEDDGLETSEPRFGSKESAIFEGVSITFIVDRGSFGGGKETQEEVDRFCGAVAVKICSMYPGAYVQVCALPAAQKIMVDGCAPVLVDEIEVAVADIGLQVWNAGEFWTK